MMHTAIKSSCGTWGVAPERIFRSFPVLLAVCVLLSWPAAVHAQLGELRLKSFGLTAQSGGNPNGLLLGSDGALYGTTVNGGAHAAGTVFRMNVNGSGYRVLYSFGANTNDGHNPQAEVIQGADGALYGTTYAGGSNNAGTVFKLNPDGSGYAVLYNFHTNGLDGQNPQAALVQGKDGLLYGTTVHGGSYAAGVVFKLGTNGTAHATLHAFGVNANDGQNPEGGLIQARDGWLYGTTYAGGANSVGTVFKLETSGAGYTVLYNFILNNEDGQNPQAALIQGVDGALYGTTFAGGSNLVGTVFRLATNGTADTILHTFTATLGDGGNPSAALVQGPDNTLYGTTTEGGWVEPEGTAFRVNPDGSGYAVFYRFDVNMPGRNPSAALVLSASHASLYGTTKSGGTLGAELSNGTNAGVGTIFALNTGGGGYSTLHTFSTSGGDGVNPQAALLQGRDGALYGTTSSGGDAEAGSVFKLNPDGSKYAVLYNFGAYGDDGWEPEAGLIQAADGVLYGTTFNGGSAVTVNGLSSGTVFKLNPDGTGYAPVHDFGFVGDPAKNPVGGVVQATDGMLYGTTENGGNNSLGTIFKVATNGLEYQVLYNFGEMMGTNLDGTSYSKDGEYPHAGLIQGTDGGLYGTSFGELSPYPDDEAYGNVFAINTDGSGFRVLHAFSPTGKDGQNPSAKLVQGRDGMLYGTTEYGGTNSTFNLSGTGYGTVFKLNPSGTGYTILHYFGVDGADGRHPAAGLVQGADGNLYGTTSDGGSYNAGVAFQLSTNGGQYTVLYNFGANGADGQNSEAALVQANNGELVGTTFGGGDMGAGTVFELLLKPLFTSIERLPDRTVQLQLAGSTNTTYHVDASTNLIDWVPLTDIFDSTGVVQYIDMNAPDFTRRFYRIVP